jgi:hypothetical protein
MKLQLLIAGQYPSCLETRDIWQQACEENGLTLEIILLEEERGRILAERLDLKSFPVLIADDQIKVVGKPDIRNAHDIVRQLAQAE